MVPPPVCARLLVATCTAAMLAVPTAAQPPEKPERAATPAPPAPLNMQIKVINLSHTDADAMATLVSRLASGPGLGPVVVTADPAQNALILRAPAEALGLVQSVVEVLDQPAKGRRLHVFRVQHISVAAAAEALSTVCSAATDGARRGGGPTIVLCKEAGAIVVVGTEHEGQWAESLLKTLDTPLGQAAAAEGAASVRIEATVFQVALTAERLADLDVCALSKSSPTLKDFQKALAAFGPVQTLYRIDQSQAFGRDNRINIGATTPFARGQQKSPTGTQSTPVEYRDTGASLTVMFEPAGADAARASIRLELSTSSDGAAVNGQESHAPVFHKVAQVFAGVVDYGQPFVMLSVDSGPFGCLAFVTRGVLHRGGS